MIIPVEHSSALNIPAILVVFSAPPLEGSTQRQPCAVLQPQLCESVVVASCLLVSPPYQNMSSAP